MKTLFKPLASLRLTMVLLALSVVLVFLGTMAQEPLGLYLAQTRFFHSAFVDLASMTAAIKKALQMFRVQLPPSTAADVMAAPYFPVFPGGYLLGSLLLANLIAAHASRFKFTWKKSGIFLVHLGIIFLLLGQLCTDMVADESGMRLAEGETKYYSERPRRDELAIVDITDGDHDSVVTIPDSSLESGRSFSHPKLPFTVRVLNAYQNSSIAEPPKGATNTPMPASQGFGARYMVSARERVTSMDARDMPSAVIELVQPDGKTLGTWLMSAWFVNDKTERPVPQSLELDGRRWQFSLRPQRVYHDFSLTLVDFRHDKYPGTEIPKNFSSRVRLKNSGTREDREVPIFMNNPLRYHGLTLYQASFDKRFDDVTILQVVSNPAWLTPYFACLVVGLGLLVQFGIHLVGFVRRAPAIRVPN